MAGGVAHAALTGQPWLSVCPQNPLPFVWGRIYHWAGASPRRPGLRVCLSPPSMPLLLGCLGAPTAPCSVHGFWESKLGSSLMQGLSYRLTYLSSLRGVDKCSHMLSSPDLNSLSSSIWPSIAVLLSQLFDFFFLT